VPFESAEAVGPSLTRRRATGLGDLCWTSTCLFEVATPRSPLSHAGQSEKPMSSLGAMFDHDLFNP
jgi:hypothetical protein